MLTIMIPESEGFDSEKSQFIKYKAQDLKLEHSLISISKWESKWKKPFLTNKKKTAEEVLYYVECMCIGAVPDRTTLSRLSEDNIDKINKYIEDSMTATWFNDSRTKHSKEIVTSEVIYAQMIGLGIPVEFEKWHINRLLTLIKVCDIMFNKSSKKNKMSQKEIYQSNRELNEARRAKMNSKG